MYCNREVLLSVLKTGSGITSFPRGEVACYADSSRCWLKMYVLFCVVSCSVYRLQQPPPVIQVSYSHDSNNMANVVHPNFIHTILTHNVIYFF